MIAKIENWDFSSQRSLSCEVKFCLLTRVDIAVNRNEKPSGQTVSYSRLTVACIANLVGVRAYPGTLCGKLADQIEGAP